MGENGNRLLIFQEGLNIEGIMESYIEEHEGAFNLECFCNYVSGEVVGNCGRIPDGKRALPEEELAELHNRLHDSYLNALVEEYSGA